VGDFSVGFYRVTSHGDSIVALLIAAKKLGLITMEMRRCFESSLCRNQYDFYLAHLGKNSKLVTHLDPFVEESHWKIRALREKRRDTESGPTLERLPELC